MGFHKQQLIADQVELGDRVPAPKPAASHVAYSSSIAFPSRRLQRKARNESASRIKKMSRQLAINAIVYIAIGAVTGSIITIAVVML